MRKSPLLLSACALAAFTAAAQAAPVFDPTGFDLRETKAFSIAVQPATTLGQTQTHTEAHARPQGYAPYRLLPNGLSLTSDARKPTAYHARQPRTELSEAHPWRVSDAPAMLDVSLQIDRFPKRGMLVLAELTPDDDAAPVLRVMVDGDRLVLRGMIGNAPENGIVLGTIDGTHTAHIVLRTQPDGHIATEVNGTSGQFRLEPKAMSIPVTFRTGAYAVDDIGTSPDQVTVTLTGLKVEHGAAGSGLRT